MRKKLSDRVDAIERRLDEPMNKPAPPDLVGQVLAEKMNPRPTPQQMRTRLIAAHAALEAVHHDLEGNWAETRATMAAIEAQLGRLELRG